MLLIYGRKRENRTDYLENSLGCEFGKATLDNGEASLRAPAAVRNAVFNRPMECGTVCTCLAPADDSLDGGHRLFLLSFFRGDYYRVLSHLSLSASPNVRKDVSAMSPDAVDGRYSSSANYQSGS
jgi:hypothetical protein